MHINENGTVTEVLHNDVDSQMYGSLDDFIKLLTSERDARSDTHTDFRLVSEQNHWEEGMHWELVADRPATFAEKEAEAKAKDQSAESQRTHELRILAELKRKYEDPNPHATT